MKYLQKNGKIITQRIAKAIKTTPNNLLVTERKQHIKAENIIQEQYELV
jgi:hypothetical protein